MKALKIISRLIIAGIFTIISDLGCITLADAVLGDALTGLVIGPMFALIVGGSVYNTIGKE